MFGDVVRRLECNTGYVEIRHLVRFAGTAIDRTDLGLGDAHRDAIDRRRCANGRHVRSAVLHRPRVHFAAVSQW